MTVFASYRTLCICLAMIASYAPRSYAAYSATFSYTGSMQTWTATGVAVFSVDAYGAAGGGPVFSTIKGGLGGWISVSNVPVSALTDNTLYIFVGGQGAPSAVAAYRPFNGGGVSCIGGCFAGGGGTDVRTIATQLSSRLVIAGGGGGASNSMTGGAGGGSFAASGGEYNRGQGGGGGSIFAGGTRAVFCLYSCPGGGSEPGIFGAGGAGVLSSGSGGGGYYGGGGGSYYSGGGGGSSYASTQYPLIINSNQQGAQSGNGVLYLTYTSCAAGYYLSGVACLACSSNTYSPVGSSSCSSSCPSGTYVSAAAACVPCPVGTFQAAAGLQTSCQSCPSNTINPFTGQALASACFLCAQGTVPTLGRSACAPCGPGTYQTSSSTCVVCGAGRYSPSSGLSTCLTCPSGRFSALSGQAICTTCSAGSYSQLAGQNSSSSCLSCPSSNTNTYSAPGSSACSSTGCPSGSFYATGSACSSCLAGYYSPSSGLQTSCVACAGRMQSSSGSSACYQPTFAFPYSGVVQSFLVPPNVASITIDAYGASGGSLAGQSGGVGGYVSAVFPVGPTLGFTVGTPLYIYVGAYGNGGLTYQNMLNKNMAGASGAYATNSGGGATDVRTSFYDLSSRVLVAGGGGGAGIGVGGAGGGNIGGTGGAGSLSGLSGAGGGGGSQSLGGAGYGTSGNGLFGVGGFGDSQTVVTFTATGAQQTFVVPAAITTLKVTACGAEGGYGSYNAGFSAGGLGGCTTAIIPASPGATLYVVVGKAVGGVSTYGGYGGGGDGNGFGGGGGGATDIRSSSSDLMSRLVVGGGGGGGARYANGGGGGGLVGLTGCGVDQGGTQTSGGLGSGTGNPGTFGVGGSGTYYSGGGGGGWYGGGGADAQCAGGGGSSYVTKNGTVVSMLRATQAGDGFLQISYNAYNVVQWASGGGGAGYYGGGGGSLSGGGGGGSSFVAMGTPYFAASITNAQGVVQPDGNGNGTLYITLNCAAGTALLGGTSCVPVIGSPSPSPTSAPSSLVSLAPSAALTPPPSQPSPPPTAFPTLLPASMRMQMYSSGSIVVTKYKRRAVLGGNISNKNVACEGEIESTKIISLDECLFESGASGDTGDIHFKHAVKVGTGKHVKALTRLAVIYADGACSVPVYAKSNHLTPLTHKLGHYIDGCDRVNNEAYVYSPRAQN